MTRRFFLIPGRPKRDQSLVTTPRIRMTGSYVGRSPRASWANHGLSQRRRAIDRPWLLRGPLATREYLRFSIVRWSEPWAWMAERSAEKL